MNTNNKLKRVIIVASKQELADTHYRKRLWLAARNMPYSRRKWLDKLAEAIYGFQGAILLPDGRQFPLPDIDQIMGDPRWFSYYFEDIDGEPKRDVRLIERLRIIDLFFRISKPDIQCHLGR